MYTDKVDKKMQFNNYSSRISIYNILLQYISWNTCYYYIFINIEYLQYSHLDY